MSTLRHAVALAARAHQGQVDKGGAAYILHPLRVMQKLNSTEEQIAGVLHDVVEDSHWTIDQLRAEGFSEPVLQAIDAVTRRPDEDYEDFILRAAADPIGSRVKVADLEDNMDLSRIRKPTARDRERLGRYERAISFIKSFHEEATP